MLLASMCNKRQKVGTLRIYCSYKSESIWERVWQGLFGFFFGLFLPYCYGFFFFKSKGAVKIFNFPLSVFAHSIKSSCNFFYLCSVLENLKKIFTLWENINLVVRLAKSHINFTQVWAKNYSSQTSAQARFCFFEW